MVNDTKMVANITVNNCSMYSGSQAAVASPAPVPTYSSPSPAMQQQQTPLPRQRTPEELNNVSERIKQAQKEREKGTEEVQLMIPAVKTEEQPEEKKVVVPLKKVCKTCNQETTIEKYCNGCGTAICDGCAVESADDGKPYCEPCWDKL